MTGRDDYLRRAPEVQDLFELLAALREAGGYQRAWNDAIERRIGRNEDGIIELRAEIAKLKAPPPKNGNGKPPPGKSEPKGWSAVLEHPDLFKILTLIGLGITVLLLLFGGDWSVELIKAIRGAP